MEQPQKEPVVPAEDQAEGASEKPADEKTPAPKKSGPARKRRRRKRPSPVPVSMWLLPPLRVPFSSPVDFIRWFFTGIDFWAIGAVALCVLAGWSLVKRFEQPRQWGVEQALSGGEGTAGLSYTVEQTGEGEVTVTGSWDVEKEQREPGPELAAALCAALSPEEIYGHSDHLYRAIASRFFEGEDFTLTIRLRRAATKEEKKQEEEPEPIFSVTREAGTADWPQPDCAAAFAKKWREEYDRYWLFGQGRKEEVGEPKADPIYEEGDRPPEPDQGAEEEAPPLPDLDGALPSFDGEDGESGESDEPPDEQEPESEPSSGEGPEDEGDADAEPPEPENWLDRLLVYASRYRGLGWKEAWELFRHPEE